MVAREPLRRVKRRGSTFSSLGAGVCDRPEVYRESLRVSRKPRKCCECGWLIAVGDHYQNAFGVYDGEAQSFSTCLPCVGVRKQVEGMGDGCWYFTDLWEDVQQLGFEDRTPEMEVFQARVDYLRKLRERDRWVESAAGLSDSKAVGFYMGRADECLHAWSRARDLLKQSGIRVEV